MLIAVIAANGRLGKAVTEQILAAGHSVRAGVHSKNPFDKHLELLTVMTCDATSQSDIEKLITGCDAVVSCIGHVKGSSATVQTDAIDVVIRTMKVLNQSRIISVTGTGVRFPGDHITLIDRLLNTLISHIDPDRIRDGKEHVEVLKKSSLDWTVLRVLKFQNTKPKKYNLSLHGPTKLYVSRLEVAEAILQVIQDDTFIKAAPMLSR